MRTGLCLLFLPSVFFFVSASARENCCWINAKTGKAVPTSQVLPEGARFDDPEHHHASIVQRPSELGPGGTLATFVRGPGNTWLNAKTGKQVPCSQVLPEGARFDDPEHNHASIVQRPSELGPGGTLATFVHVPCPPPSTSAGTPAPSHASVKTSGQPIVEINPPTPVPLFELGVGYNYIHAPDEDVKDLHGFNASFFYNYNGWLSFGGEVMGGYGCESFDEFGSTVHTSLDRYVYVFGPRVSVRPSPNFTLFAQAMVGGDHDSSDTTFRTNLPVNAHAASVRTSFSSSADCWAFDFGVGADWRFAQHWSWRIVEASYLATTFSSGNNDHWQDNWRVSTGLVYHWGGPRTATSTAATYDSKDAPISAK